MNPEQGSTYIYDGVNYGFPDPFFSMDKECRDIVALCLLNHAGVDIPDNDEIVIEKLEISSFGIHIKVNGKDFWLKARSVDTFENLIKEFK